MQETDTTQETATESGLDGVKKDSTKIYFFIVAIVALLATNVYFYIKYKNTGDKVYELTDEKVSLQAEVDRIEAELDRLTDNSVTLNSSLKSAQDSVRSLIANLRTELAQNNLTREQLASAQQEVAALKQQVSDYLAEVQSLRSENNRLVIQRVELEEEVSASSERLQELEEQNTDLNDKLKMASALKVSNMAINGVRQRSGDRESTETRARRVDKLKIDFTVADNPLAEVGMHEVYIRVIDPNGNLRTTDRGLFEVDGNQMQYTFKTNIGFENDGASYVIEWTDAKGFQKGTYTIVLYASNSVMGHGSIVLK